MTLAALLGGHAHPLPKLRLELKGAIPGDQLPTEDTLATLAAAIRAQKYVDRSGRSRWGDVTGMDLLLWWVVVVSDDDWHHRPYPPPHTHTQHNKTAPLPLWT